MPTPTYPTWIPAEPTSSKGMGEGISPSALSKPLQSFGIFIHPHLPTIPTAPETCCFFLGEQHADSQLGCKQKRPGK